MLVEDIKIKAQCISCREYITVLLKDHISREWGDHSYTICKHSSCELSSTVMSTNDLSPA